MSEGQSQRSVALSVQYRQEAEVAAAKERERAEAETAATAARAARLAIAELAAARAEVEAAAAADAARAAAVELKALRASSTDSSVSATDDRDNELKLARETAREQAAQWAAAHPQERRVSSTAAATQTGAGTSAVGLMEITAFTSGAALPPRTGTMVTTGSRPLSGTSVPAAGGLPSPRPTTSSGPR
jgi:colicin import membrane protein